MNIIGEDAKLLQFFQDLDIDVKVPPSEAVHSLVALGLLAPSADNYQPLHCTWNGVSLITGYDQDRVAGKTFSASDSATLMTLGGVVENFSAIASQCGFNLDTDLAAQPGDANVLAITHFDDIDIPQAYLDDNPIISRHTNRLAYQKAPVSVPTLNRLAEMEEGGARLVIHTSAPQKSTIAGIAESASTIRFRTREVHEWLGDSLRFTADEVSSGDGLDVESLGLPPGGALFLKFTRDWKRMHLLNKIGAYRIMAKIDSAPLEKAPALIAFCAPANRQGAIQAGMLLNRVWKYLNSQGVAAHPYYVVSDQLARADAGKVPISLIGLAEEIRHRSEVAFELADNETVHMLLRAGYPQREAIRSRRLPLEQVFTDLTA